MLTSHSGMIDPLKGNNFKVIAIIGQWVEPFEEASRSLHLNALELHFQIDE